MTEKREKEWLCEKRQMTDGRTRGAAETQRSQLVRAGEIDIRVKAELRNKVVCPFANCPNRGRCRHSWGIL